MNECTCQYTESHYAAAWHDEDCPRYQNQCTRCEGEGYLVARLGCGCCHDREDCDWCDGTGNEPPYQRVGSVIERLANWLFADAMRQCIDQYRQLDRIFRSHSRRSEGK